VVIFLHRPNSYTVFERSAAMDNCWGWEQRRANGPLWPEVPNGG